MGGIKRLIPLCKERNFAVSGDDLACPWKSVNAPDACRLWSYPQLQVLGAVVVSDAVAVMHVLARQEIASQHLLHDQDVLEHVTPVAGPRVLGCPDHRVSVLVAGPPAPPVVVGRPALGVAGGTGGRLVLLASPARAEIVRPARRAAKVPT